jgi:hypothetical protein
METISSIDEAALRPIVSAGLDSRMPAQSTGSLLFTTI